MSKRDMYEKIKIARKHALRRQGYEFIELELLKSHMRRIQGIEIVNVIQSEDVDNPGKPRYDFNLGGGRLDFVMDENRGGLFDDIVDTPKNRKFLARHIGMKIWRIVDKEIEQVITELSKKVVSEVLKPVNGKKTQNQDVVNSDDDNVEDTQETTDEDTQETTTKQRRKYTKKGAAIIEDTGNS
jgi:hypothetical protein